MQKRHSFHTKNTPRRTRDTKKKDDESGTKWYRFGTQQIRRDLTRGLGELYEDSLRFSQDKTLSNTQREKWGRLAGSLAQTINTVTRTYDEIQVEKAITELREYVETHLEQ
jgi:hypothetical protein